MENKLIAGFDLSCNSTGVCIINEKNSIVHAESINPYPLEGIQRLNYIYDRVYSILSSYDIQVIGFERQVSQQRFSYTAGSILPLAEVLGVFKLALHKTTSSKDIAIYAFSPQVLKTNLAGDPKADKDKMMESLGTRCLNHLKNNIVESSINDCTDAYSAALAASKVVKGTFTSPYDVIKEIPVASS